MEEDLVLRSLSLGMNRQKRQLVSEPPPPALLGLLKEFDISPVALAFGATCVGEGPTGFMIDCLPKAWAPKVYCISHWQQHNASFGFASQTLHLRHFPYNFARFSEREQDWRYAGSMVQRLYGMVHKWIRSIPGTYSSGAKSQGAFPLAASWSFDYHSRPRYSGQILMSIFPAPSGKAMLEAHLIEAVCKSSRRKSGLP